MFNQFEEKPKTLIFSTKDKAQEFIRSIDTNEIRGKFSVRKTKGWKTYSVLFKPFSYSDLIGIMKVYKPEHSHYIDIAKQF